MSTFLVSLVSKQTLPNVLFIKEMKDIDKYLFITTKYMEEKHRRKMILDTCSEINESNCHSIEVLEDSLEDLDNKLKNFIEKETTDEDSFIVNLTCGTKIMSIGTYNFFRDHVSKIYYITLGKNFYRQIFPEIKHREFELNYRISLKGYIVSYGISVKVDGGELNQPIEITRKLFNLCNRGIITERYSNLLQILRKERKKIRNKIKPVDEFDKLSELFEEIGASLSKISKNEVEYLTGGWLEEYIYYYFSKYIEKDKIGLNYVIKLKTNVQNEFDVIFVHNNEMYIIEAKISVRKGGEGLFFIREVLYKSAALKKEFGLSVKSFIFTLDKDLFNNHNFELFKSRANLMGISLLGPDKIDPENIEDTIKKLLN